MTKNETASKPVRTVRDWWIATDFLDKGGRKVMGPFVSRDLAMQVRTLRETVEGHAAYFVDSEAPTTREATDHA